MNEQQWVKLMELGSKLGCHQMPERSFFYKNYQFPVCARCTGVLLATCVAVMVFIKKRVSKIVCFIMSGVMLTDWMSQYLGIKESTNVRRFVTGLVGGFGYTTLHLYLYRFIYKKIQFLFYEKAE